MAQAKLITMTVGLTVLIWVSADQLLRESDEVLVKINPVAVPGTGMAVTAENPDQPPFRVKVSGPRKVIAKNILGRVLNVELPVAEQTPGQYAVPGRYALKDLGKELQRLSVPAFEGLSIEEVEPGQLAVIVDRDVTVTMPVRIVDAGSFDFGVEPTVQPGEVQVTISHIELNGLDPNRPGIPAEQRYVALNVSRHLSTFPEGELFSRDVLIDPQVAGVGVKVEPAEVRLMAELRERRRQATISAVPISFQASQAVFNRYFVDRRDNFTLLTQPITIRGPEDVVERIVSGETKVFGTIPLTTPDADSVGVFRHVTPRFVLPADVELVEAPAPVEFRLMPNKAAVNGDGNGRGAP
ncbi:MAG: hypothetical protein JSV19_03820 [Phycisphaerales bacterium]|nr:MAG: hypothetical protein JSV19_03820 [Phycisphaerales bacterium]